MPILVQNDLPVKQVLEQENIFVMDERRAHTQEIRPLQILILNLMPLKEATELDPEKRKQILAEEVFPAIAAKVPHMTLFDSTMIYAMGKDVKGFNPSPTTGMMFNKIYFEE